MVNKKMNETAKPIVLVVDKMYQKASEVFETAEGFDFISAPGEEAVLSDMIKEKNAFSVVLGDDRYKGSLYESLRSGAVLARFGVGYDGIDLEKAKQYNLLVTNTPDVLDSTVAEFTIFLAAEVLRKVGTMNAALHQGSWTRIMGNDLHGKVWAIVGFGVTSCTPSSKKTSTSTCLEFTTTL